MEHKIGKFVDKKGTKTLLLGMTEKEQKGLKLISLSLVLGSLLDKKEHLLTKREQHFCWE